MREAGSAKDIEIEPLGETFLLLRFGSRLDVTLNARVAALAAELHGAALPGIVDIVPAYASLGLHYDPAAWRSAGSHPWRNLAEAVLEIGNRAGVREAPDEVPVIDIPVCYGNALGPDLAAVANHCGLTRDDVVRRHCEARYRVAMLGFAPGFPYLLGLDPALQVPRHPTPRTHVPAGSVAIGGAQTGIYPRELPGGWQIIGRTPLRLFDTQREPPCLLAIGDRVRFRAVDEARFEQMTRRAA